MSVDESRYRPTREAVFTETMQIGIVVRDLDATLRRYVDDYGIGPWQLFEVTPENAPDLYHDGQPVKGSARSAVAMVGKALIFAIASLLMTSGARSAPTKIRRFWL